MTIHPREQIERDREPDGLSAGERATVRAHIAECGECRAYADDLARNDRLLSRRELPVALPAVSSHPGGTSVPALLAGVAVVVLVVITALGIARESTTSSVVGASSTPSGSIAATAASSSTAGASASATASPTSTAPASASPSNAPSSSPSTTSGTGPLRGNWVFIGKRITDPSSPRATVEIWGVPLDGGDPRLAYAYATSTGGAPEASLDAAPYLRRQFSPDGKQLVLSVDGELVIVDVETGHARSLGITGNYPAWSKDGSLIAYVHPGRVGEVVPPPLQVAVVAPTGGTPRDLGVTSEPTQSVEWSPDGRTLLFPTRDGLALLDVGSARVLRILANVGHGSPSVAHWRRGGSPQIAIVEGGCAQGTARVSVVADESASARTIVDAGVPCSQVLLRDPRWNPVSTNELLYVRAAVSPGIEPADYVLRIADLSGRDVATPLRAYEATWSWTGTQIVYIVKSDAAPYGTVVSLANRADFSSQRDLLRADAGAIFFSVASLSY